MERVIVAFESEKTCERICDILESGCAASCLRARSAGEVKRLAGKHHIGTVVCGFKLKDETAEDLFYDLPQSSVMLVIAHQSQLDMLSEDVFSLPAPVARGDLCLAVEMALQMNRRLERMLRPKRNTDENDIVEKAKRILMERDGMTEEQAHRFLQKKSMDNGSKMVQTAILILEDKL